MWCALIFYLSSIPDLKSGLEEWDFVLRKIAHALVYSILYLLSRSAFAPHPLRKENKGDLTYAPHSAVFSIMYAITDEYHQNFVPGRNFSVIDIAIDAAGVLSAMYFERKNIMQKIISSLKSCVPFALLILFIGCAGYEISRLNKMLSRGKFVDAAVGFERFALKNPSHQFAPYALLRAAQIYNYCLRLPSKSASLYRKIEEDFSSRPDLVEKARQGLLRSPDYMPLVEGARWIEGDSASGGSNMRAVWTAQEISTGSFLIEKKYTAGGTESRSVAIKKLYYIYKGSAIIEKSSLSDSPDKEKIFFDYPLYHGKKWRYYDKSSNVTLEYQIEFVPGIVEVRAGKFFDCIRIGEKTTTSSVIKYDYYAPYVGWILTSVGGGRAEHRNSELISYELPDIFKKICEVK